MTLSVFTNFQGDIITGIRDADFAKEAFQVQSGADSFNCDDILLGHGVTGFSTENLDSRLINHDDFLLVNNGGSTESVNGTIGYEMQVGMGISANARGKTTGTIAALQIETGSGDDYIVDHIGGTAGPGGTSFLTGYAEAVGLDSSTVDVMNNVISSLQPANEFI